MNRNLLYLALFASSFIGVANAATQVPAHGSIDLSGGNSTDADGDTLTYRYDVIDSDGSTVLTTIDGDAGTLDENFIYGLTNDLGYAPANVYSIRMAVNDGTVSVYSAMKSFSVTPNFLLEGSTITCADADVGDTGVVNGVKYYAVDDSNIGSLPSGATYSTVCTTHVTNIDNLFEDDADFNENISFWDTSNFGSMDSTFLNATSFNQPIGGWDTANVDNFFKTFKGAEAFNQPLTNWSFKSVTDSANAESMFEDATAFDQDISHICAADVGEMPTDFDLNAGFEDSTEQQPDWGGSCN